MHCFLKGNSPEGSTVIPKILPLLHAFGGFLLHDCLQNPLCVHFSVSKAILCLWGQIWLLGNPKVNPSSAQWSVCVGVVVSVISCHNIAAKEITRKTSGTHNKYYLAYDSAGIQLIWAGFGWSWQVWLMRLQSADLVWACQISREQPNDSGLEWPHLNIWGTQLCLTCLSFSIRLAGGIFSGWWQRHKEKETSM